MEFIVCANSLDMISHNGVRITVVVLILKYPSWYFKVYMINLHKRNRLDYITSTCYAARAKIFDIVSL